MKKALVLSSFAAVAALTLSACASDYGHGSGGHHARPGGGHSQGGRPNQGAHRPDGNHNRPHSGPNGQQGRPGGGHGGGHGGGSRPQGGPAAAAQCQVSDYSQYVGRTQSDVPRAPRGLTYRFVGPNTPTTRDHRVDRVNFNHNAEGIITSVSCG